MKKIHRIIFVLITFLMNSYAFSQILGGDVSVSQTSSSQFLIKVKLISDCRDTSTPVNLDSSFNSSLARIFDGGNDTLIETITAGNLDSIVPVKIGDACYTPPGYCPKAHYYSILVNLKISSNGYYFTWKVGNRLSPLNLTGGNSHVFYARFSQDISLVGNSSPTFNYSVSKGYTCVGYIHKLDFSCIEPDGDSLVYSIVNPTVDFSLSGSKPFTFSNYDYGISQPLGIGSYCTINSKTGMVSARIAQLGLYSLAVKCEEYRGGIKISEVVKDYVFSGLSCNYGLPVDFVDFPKNYIFEYGKLNCFDVVSRADNSLNPVHLQITSEAMTYGLTPTLPFSNSDGTYNFKWEHSFLPYEDTANNLKVIKSDESKFEGLGRVGTRVCWDLRGCNKYPKKEYIVDLQTNVDRCGLKDTMNTSVTIKLIEPNSTSSYSQVLSPNGDGINDLFKLPLNDFDECFKFESAVIFNSLGQRMYETINPEFYWNGIDFSGNLVPSGIYLVQVKGKYGENEHTESYKLLVVR